ncbi:hypothetical protein FISHEDRAFT_74928 [Fistulina hepatica ATCC 64428]|uniref:Uncharacterized protein n=1 Tax=Fistulina hepatica ATCC 64428 TaxID=1128425 RepID=A0A0D7AB69_9AGAR|nr:hypothetical protein FISHEDRAFT_74928 [Fistulina hepatica ATCC 64428]
MPLGPGTAASAPETPWTEVQRPRSRAAARAGQDERLQKGKGKDIPRDLGGDAYMTGPSSNQIRMAEDEGRVEGAKKRRRADSGNRFEALSVDVGGPNDEADQWPALMPTRAGDALRSGTVATGSLLPSNFGSKTLPLPPHTPDPVAHASAQAGPSTLPAPRNPATPSTQPQGASTSRQGNAAPGQPGGTGPAQGPVTAGQGQNNGNNPANAAAQFGAAGNHGAAPVQGAPPPSTIEAATFTPNSVPFCEHIPEITVGLHPQVAAAWEALEGPKAGIRPWMSRRNINTAHFINTIRADIAQRLNVRPQAVRLYFPTPAEPGPIYSMPNQLLLQFDPELVPEQEALNHILSMFNNGDHGFRNTSAATYWVLPYTNPHVGSTFMGVITRLSGLMETDTAIVRDMVRRELATDAVLANYVRMQRVNAPANIPDDEVFQWWLDTIRVDTIVVNAPGGVPMLHFRVWCQYASDYVEAIDYVRRRFFAHTYMDGLHGIGVPDFFDRRCNNCKCLSHPTGLCPFVRLPEFITPDATGEPVPTLDEEALEGALPEATEDGEALEVVVGDEDEDVAAETVDFKKTCLRYAAHS